MGTDQNLKLQNKSGIISLIDFFNFYFSLYISYPNNPLKHLFSPLLYAIILDHHTGA